MAAQFKTCSIEGCNGNAHYSANGARGWCSSHWQRWKRHGDPLEGRTHDGALMAFVQAAISDHAEDKCLLWPYSKTKGYGALMVDGSLQYAHRLVCTAVNGVAPTQDHQAAHGCGNRACIAPRHLRWATAAENQADRVGHGTSNRGTRHGNARLTEQDAKQILTLKGKIPQSKLAEKFGVSREHVRDIQNRRSWAWLSIQPEPRV